MACCSNPSPRGIRGSSFVQFREGRAWYSVGMAHSPQQVLFVSAALEFIVSCGLGFVMLIPMQPWARGLRERWPPARALMSVHLDLVMLALMQAAAGAAVFVLPRPHDGLAAVLLVTSGWLNVTPYAWRLVGVNAFALSGGPLQRFAALTSLLSTLALTGGWITLLSGWL